MSAAEIRRLRKDLSDSHKKIQTLTSQLATNVSNLSFSLAKSPPNLQFLFEVFYFFYGKPNFVIQPWTMGRTVVLRKKLFDLGRYLDTIA